MQRIKLKSIQRQNFTSVYDARDETARAVSMPDSQESLRSFWNEVDQMHNGFLEYGDDSRTPV